MPVAEGEELGSNLLHVAQSSPGDPVPWNWDGDRKSRPYRKMAVRDGPTACRAAGWPAQPGNPDEGRGRGGLDRIGEPGTGLGTWIRPDNSRQLKDLSPQVLHLRDQKQILPIRHRKDGIQHLL